MRSRGYNRATKKLLTLEELKDYEEDTEEIFMIEEIVLFTNKFYRWSHPLV